MITSFFNLIFLTTVLTFCISARIQKIERSRIENSKMTEFSSERDANAIKDADNKSDHQNYFIT